MSSNLWPRNTISGATQERARAAYIGFAIGDALGATTEFMRPGEIQAKYRIHKDIIGGGWLSLKAGKVTDDTQMSLALGDALVETGTMDERAIANKFVDWMSAKPPDIGHTIRQKLNDYKLSGKVYARYSESAGGNGALMRNLPVIIATAHFPELLYDWSLRQGMITHNNRLAKIGLLMISKLSQQIILNAQETPLKDLTRKWTAQYPRFDYSRYKRSVDGYIADTIKTVLFFFFNTSDFESCLIGVVNAGGDADTNAAIAGMLAGPFYGIDSIPRRWVKKLDKRVKTQIEEQTNQLVKRFWS